jgi:hypothetical protein
VSADEGAHPVRATAREDRAGWAVPHPHAAWSIRT